jgi:hypothetical protein
MPEILSFSRNICTVVEQIRDDLMTSSCRLQDTLMDAYVKISVKIPDLEINGIEGKLERSFSGEKIDVEEAFNKIMGTRVGPGIRKIIRGFIGNSATEKQLAFMVEECCSGLILSFTKDQMKKIPKDPEKARHFFENLVRENPRLYKGCAALSPGSPLVDNIKFD